MKLVVADQLVRSLEVIVQNSKETNVRMRRSIVQEIDDTLRAKIHGTLSRPPLMQLVGLMGKSVRTTLDAHQLMDMLNNILNTQSGAEVIVSRPILVNIIGELRGRVDGLLDIYPVEGEQFIAADSMAETVPDEPMDKAWTALIDSAVLESAELRHPGLKSWKNPQPAARPAPEPVDQEDHPVSRPPVRESLESEADKKAWIGFIDSGIYEASQIRKQEREKARKKKQ